jgi:nucleoid DNA-binding protein
LAIFKNIAKNIKQNNQKDKIKLIEKKEIFFMVKNEVINAIAERIEGAKKGDIALILDTYAEVITDTLKTDATESVPVGKLGKFKVKDVPERTGKIMLGDRKGEEYITPAHQEITFKMNKSAKQL